VQVLLNSVWNASTYFVPAIWAAIRIETAIWRNSGHVPLLWWRDDDAQFDTPSLRRLLTLATTHDVPLMLAVIPVGDLRPLCGLLADLPLVTVAQHGVTHINVSAPDEPNDEFQVGTDIKTMAEAIASTNKRLSNFSAAVPVYVPPWNRVNENLSDAVKLAGLQCLSAHRKQSSQNNLVKSLNVDLDLLTWKTEPHFRGTLRVLWRFLVLLRKRRILKAWHEPVGLLTHHLAHDEEAWNFLGEFLGFTQGTSAKAPCRWVCGASYSGLR